jgi:putative phosphoribosyl transferase
MTLPTRTEAGRQLGRLLGRYVGIESPVVVALSPAGVAVAYEVATALEAPLDILIPGKLGVPGHPRPSLGAVAPGVRMITDPAVGAMPSGYFDALAERTEAECELRARKLRGNLPQVSLAGRVVILVDDGRTEALPVLAAVAALRLRGASKVLCVAPFFSRLLARDLQREADELVVLYPAAEERTYPLCHEAFAQPTGADVTAMLRHTRRTRPGVLPSGRRHEGRRAGERREAAMT